MSGGIIRTLSISNNQKSTVVTVSPGTVVSFLPGGTVATLSLDKVVTLSPVTVVALLFPGQVL